jgi:hypothetical protein
VDSLRRLKTWALFYQTCISPKFETLPLYFIPCHPLPTQHLPRYLRCTSFLLVSCRSLTSFPHSTWLLLLGHLLSGLPTQSRRHHVPSLHRCHGHSATLVTSLGSGRHGPHGKHLLLPRRDCLPTGRSYRDRLGCNASPQDLERITVRLPSGIGHGKGPGSATADLVYPKVVPVTPPVALTVNRSRHSVGPRAQPDPGTRRHDARAILSPSALDEHANRPKCPGEGPTGTEYVTNNDKVYVASAQGTW